MVAATLASVLQRAQALNATELCNVDRTDAELLARPPGPCAPLSVVLDGVPAEEVGVLLRTCEAAHIQRVIVCGETPGPPDPKVLKTSLHAEERVPVRRASSMAEALRALRVEGHALWALAAGEGAAASAAPGPPPQPLALVLLGGDCPAEAAASCDAHMQLPGCSVVGAGKLSTAVAGSVAVYDILRRWGL